MESGPAAGALPVFTGGVAGAPGDAEPKPKPRTGPKPGSGPDPAPESEPDSEEDPSRGEVYLASRPGSAARARRLAVAVMLKWGLDSHAELVELLVSELVGNAVRHTGGGFGLRIRRPRGLVKVEVRDASRALPCLLPVQALDVGGRGLFLVNKLSARWGVDLQPRGKTTWFELRVPDV